jgi:hypothetical protein
LEGLDYLGAAEGLLGAGEGLSTQTILLRVRSIDVSKFRAAINKGAYGAVVEPALAVVDQFPKLAVDLALPLVKQKLEALGITADLSVTNAPPPPRAPAETKTAFFIGGVLGALLAIAGAFGYSRYARRSEPSIRRNTG